MMWISSIKLWNFKSYEKAAFHFPEPKHGQNLVLIGAKNGHGKTTLLEAIYFCLYDDDAIRYLTRAGLNNEEIRYPDFLNQALFHQAKPQHGQYKMGLQIEICTKHRSGKVETLTVQRLWHFNAKRICDIKDSGSRETRVKLSDNTGQSRIIDDADIGHILNRYALPFEYAPFFFFDGEKIVQAAERNGAGFWLGGALKSLLGVSLLHNLKDSLNKYRTQNISASASQKMQADLHQAQAALKEAEATLHELQNQWENVHENKNIWESKRDKLTTELGSGRDIKTQGQLVEQRSKLENEQKQFADKVKTAVLAMPLALLPEKRMLDLSQQFEAEAKRLNWEEGKKQLDNRVEEFWGAFQNNQKVREVMGRSADFILADDLMKEAVAECWQQIFDPAPQGYAQKIVHNYLSVSAYESIRHQISQLQSLPNEPIEDLLAQIEQYEHDVAELNRQIHLLSDEPRYNERVKLLQEANAKTADLIEQATTLRTHLASQEQKVAHLRQEINHLQSQMEGNDPKLRKSQRAGQIEKMIDDLSAQLLTKKVLHLGETATRINKQIAHDERISRIQIAENGMMTLLGKDGNVIQAGLSAGQMQILIMSLVSALAEVTYYHAPCVIDTPLARLDSEHRQGLFKHWSGLSQQVILLSQDTEITTEVSQQLAPHISKTYLVEADSLDSGGATSLVQENVYFS